VDLFTTMPYPSLQKMLDAGAPSGQRNYFRGGYLDDLSDAAIQAVLDHAPLLSPLSQIHLHQMGGRVARSGADHSSFSGRAAGYTYNLIGTWTDQSEDAVRTAAVREAAAALAPMSTGRSYVNFSPEQGDAHVRRAYGDDIYDRLSRLKREHDPSNVFNRNQNVRPAT
jgi:hypothetical protein